MFNRQRAILYLLAEASRPVGRLELMKWSFLLGIETPSGGGNSFYQFLPYKYGPFSHCLYRETGTLVDREMISACSEKTWSITGEGQAIAAGLSREVKRDVRRIVERFGNKQTDELIDYVYQRFPYFTVNSERKRLETRPTAEPAIYTAGYEGLHIDGFLDRLIRHGIQRIIDVRRNPVARRYGFHRSTLRRLAGAVDIAYEHVPQLGIASEQRRRLDSPGDYQRLFQAYEATTLQQQTDAIEHVAHIMSQEPSVLVCMEADPHCCHRTRLARTVAKQTGLPILDLGDLECKDNTSAPVCSSRS